MQATHRHGHTDTNVSTAGNSRTGTAAFPFLGQGTRQQGCLLARRKAKPARAGFARNAMERGELAGEDAFSDEEDLGFFQGQVGRGQHQV